MRGLTLAAATLALLAPPAAAQGVSDTCKAAIKSGWPAVSKATESGNWKVALAKLGPLDIACAADPPAIWLFTTVRAEGELRLGDAHAALTRLEAIAVPTDADVYPSNRWVYLAVSEAVGDQARFTAALDGFISAHDKAMTARKGVTRIETFETPAAKVWAYQGDIQNGPFLRKMVFVAVPKAGGWPASISVADDQMSAALLGDRAKAPVLTVDAYNCEDQALLYERPFMRDGKLDYQAAKSAVIERFSRPDAFQAFGSARPPHFCAFESFVLPGYSDGGEG